MTRRQWMWLWVWLLLFLIIFCVWNKLQTYKSHLNSVVDTKTISDKSKVIAPTIPSPVKEEPKSVDLNFKIVKEDSNITFSGLFPSKKVLEDIENKFSSNVKEGTISIDENAKNDKILKLLPALADDFSQLKSGYIEYNDKKLSIDGLTDNKELIESINQKAKILGDSISFDNVISFEEPPKKEVIQKEEPQESKEDIQKEINDVLKLKKVEFIFAKDILTSKGKQTIDEVAKILKKHKNIRVEIGGHTDSIGNEKNNKILSQKRADAVKRYLVKKVGIASERLRSVGYGESKPLVKNDTPKHRQTNRRVEFKIIGDK